ncbi:MAG: PAS domain-containing protein [Halothiobacillaceae bacterium]
MKAQPVTGQEIVLKPTQTIQSRTDERGVITYANPTLVEVSGFSREELEGRPHNILRHPDMPRSVFQLMWETIQSGQEFYGYVVNRAKSGDHYWVIAYVAPRRDAGDRIIGYSSVRRAPLRERIEEWADVYRRMRAIEAEVDRSLQCAAGRAWLEKYLRRTRYPGLTEYVLSGL